MPQGCAKWSNSADPAIERAGPRHATAFCLGLFLPWSQRGGAHPAVLANEVDNAPATIALLNMREGECRNL